jgi:hypothetical protein
MEEWKDFFCSSTPPLFHSSALSFICDDAASRAGMAAPLMKREDKKTISYPPFPNGTPYTKLLLRKG